MADEQSVVKHLSKEQKIGFVLLLCFAILTVSLGLLQIRNTMYAPFALNTNIPTDLKEKVNDQMALQYRDTDFDGLSDFDELYVYSTSPYLADSDSDGIPDKQEVDLGKDPNCAEGQTCIPEGTAQVDTSSTTLVNVVDPGVAPQDLTKMLTDPVQLRQMLLQAGMDKKVLDSYADKDLLKMTEDLMAATVSSTPTKTK
jgi:hypothetical protein